MDWGLRDLFLSRALDWDLQDPFPSGEWTETCENLLPVELPRPSILIYHDGEADIKQYKTWRTHWEQALPKSGQSSPPPCLTNGSTVIWNMGFYRKENRQPADIQCVIIIRPCDNSPPIFDTLCDWDFPATCLCLEKNRLHISGQSQACPEAKPVNRTSVHSTAGRQEVRFYGHMHGFFSIEPRECQQM